MNASFPSASPLPTSTANPPLEGQSSEQDWSARTIILATLTACAVTLGFLLVYRFYMAVFLLFTAFALQVAFQPIIEAVHRRGIRRSAGVFLVYALMLFVLLLLVWFTAPLIVDQARSVINELPAYYQNLRTSLAGVQSGLVRGIASTLPEQISLSSLASLANSTTTGAATVSGTAAAATAESSQGWQAVQVGGRTLFAIFAVFALAFYWTLEGELIQRKLIMNAPATQRNEMRTLISEIQLKIGAYFRGQLILCVIIGTMSTLAYLMIGVPNALLLGLIAGIFEAIPMIGPALGGIPAVVVTLGTAPERAIWVVIALIVIQSVESNFLVLRIMDKSVGVSAVVSILALAAFGALFGIPGAILAIPLAAILQILLSRLLFNAPLAEEAAPTVTDPIQVSRSKLGFLRMQAQELAHDIRKQARDENNSEIPDNEIEQVEDEIEMIALDLDRLLAQFENEEGSEKKNEEEVERRKAGVGAPSPLVGRAVEMKPIEVKPVQKGSGLP